MEEYKYKGIEEISHLNSDSDSDSGSDSDFEEWFVYNI